MASDIATLGIRVDSSGVQQGAQNLDQLADAAERAEDASLGVGTAIKKAGTEAATAGQMAATAGRGFSQSSQAIGAAALSAKQYSQALRQVPMQLTDIVTGLVSGQPAYMVAIQQGGQLRDAFGGIGPAARALGGAVFGLVNPFTAAAAAAGLLALRIHNSQREAFEFQKAVILTGGAANLTADQLADMAHRLDGIAGTQRNASRVLAELASTGRVAASVMQSGAEAAIRLQQVAGIAAEETIRNLVALGERPYEASKKLDQQYNHLNAATLERIRLLEEEGRVSEAAALAQLKFAEVARERAAELEKHLGVLPRLARAAGQGFSEMWEALMNVGSGVSPADVAAQVGQFLTRGPSGFAANIGFDYASGANAEERRRREQEEQRERARATFEDGQTARRERARAANEVYEAAQEAWARRKESNLQQEVKLAREIELIRKEGLRARASEAEIEQQIAAFRARHAKAPQENAGENSAKSLIESIQQQIEANRVLAETGEKASASDRLGASARKMLADTTNTMTGATRELLATMLPSLAASDKAAEAAQRERREKEALVRQNAILAQQADNRLNANDVELMSFGRGQDSRDQLHRRIDINREYADELRRLGDRAVAEDQATWDKLAAGAEAHRDEMLHLEAEFQRQRAIAMADPLNGAIAAWEDYVFTVRNVSSQTYDLISGAFDEAGAAIAEFAKGGKLSFSSLADSILSDLARLGANKLLMMLVGQFTPLGEVQGAGVRIGSVDAEAANGGVFRSADLSRYSGQVVNKPTIFAFARGAGLMGEAGPEAIMPLKRTASGKLGVEVAAGGGGELQVVVNNYGGGQVKARRERGRGPDGADIRRLIIDVVADDSAHGGPTWQAIKHRAGLQETV